MVNGFDKISDKVLGEYTNTSLLAFFKMDENFDTWSMLYSNPLIDESESGKEYRREIFKKLAEIIVEILQSRVNEISRIGVFSTEDHLVSDALKFRENTHITEDTPMNGNLIHEGYIMISKDIKDISK